MKFHLVFVILSFVHFTVFTSQHNDPSKMSLGQPKDSFIITNMSAQKLIISHELPDELFKQRFCVAAKSSCVMNPKGTLKAFVVPNEKHFHGKFGKECKTQELFAWRIRKGIPLSIFAEQHSDSVQVANRSPQKLFIVPEGNQKIGDRYFMNGKSSIAMPKKGLYNVCTSHEKNYNGVIFYRPEEIIFTWRMNMEKESPSFVLSDQGFNLY